MIQFPITDLLDRDEGYRFLRETLHPNRLHCPTGHPLPKDQPPHDRKPAPLLKYRCRRCGKVFNVFTGTVWSATEYDCATVVMLRRRFAQGGPTLHLANELALDYASLLERRHRVQALALENCDKTPWPDAEVEADELFQNAGEKRTSTR